MASGDSSTPQSRRILLASQALGGAAGLAVQAGDKPYRLVAHYKWYEADQYLLYGLLGVDGHFYTLYFMKLSAII